MTRRNGIPSLLDVAIRMCQLIVTFTPTIQRQYPSNTALLAALAAANAACGLLAEQLVEVREFGD